MRGPRQTAFTDLSRAEGLEAVVAYVVENGGLVSGRSVAADAV